VDADSADDVEDVEQVARPRVAAGALFFDESGRVLLLQPSYKPGWEIPGGYVRAGETPYQGAVREVGEELGITPPLGSLLAVDWAPHSDEGDKVLFVFDGGLLGREYVERIRPDPGEVSGYAFRSVAEFEELLIPRLARRVVAAVLARAAGETVYLEDGEARPRDGAGS
jgi:8-oxo-dGTP pyrophosphatase MutT (NUDIX family)